MRLPTVARALITSQEMTRKEMKMELELELETELLLSGV